MHIECMVMHDIQNLFLIFFYQLGLLSPLPSGEKEVSQTPHSHYQLENHSYNTEVGICRNLLGDWESRTPTYPLVIPFQVIPL